MNLEYKLAIMVQGQLFHLNKQELIDLQKIIEVCLLMLNEPKIITSTTDELPEYGNGTYRINVPKSVFYS